MHTRSTHATTPPAAHLQRRQVFRLHGRIGQRIECRGGQLWITQDGDPRDVVIAANGCFTLDRSGPALVAALQDASFVVHQAPRRSLSWATLAAWVGWPAREPARPAVHGACY